MRSLFFLCCLIISASVRAQTSAPADRPKLVVGIVVDQMRQEYLYRYYPKFGADGFKRLVNDGFMLKNGHYNYTPTLTGPGHASIYTGATPSVHGIIGNDFYDKQLKKMVNCVGDPMYASAVENTSGGNVSPWRLMSSTITDELKLFTNRQSKVIGISMKDRSAVLPAGHMADAAYWYDGASAKFITSTYYVKTVPAWVAQFNQKNLPAIYLSQDWKTLLPLDQYKESGPDQSPYERKLEGKTSPTFPYQLPAMREKAGSDLLVTTPFGNDLVTEFVKAALTAEKLGKDPITDFLCVSFSSTDAIGHAMGPRSVEVEDTYLRLDRNIADLLKKLDQEVGPNNYVVFLTADHAVGDVPQLLKDGGIPAGYFNDEQMNVMLKEFLASYFPGKDLIANISNRQVYLNQEAFQGAPKVSGVDLFIVSELVGRFLMNMEGVSNFFTEGMLRQGRYEEEGMKGMMIRGYNQKRSGDVLFALEPGWLSGNSATGTTHGSGYRYDTHVPVIFYGKGIRKGSSVRYHGIDDIAPTLSVLLNIPFPNASTGKPVEEIFE